MNGSSVGNIVTGLVVFAFILGRQVQTRPVKTDSAMKTILVLGGIGLVELDQATYGKGYTLGEATITLMVASLVVAAVLGAGRALSVKVWRDAKGTAFMRGTILTVILWIVSLAIHFGFEVAIDRSTTIPGGLGQVTILPYLAASLGIQREVARFRAAQVHEQEDTAP
jgi:hypothetical protein